MKGARIAVWDEDEAFPLAAEVRERWRAPPMRSQQRDVVIGNASMPVSGAELMTPYMQTLAAVLGSDLPDDVYNAFASMQTLDRKTLAEGGDGGAAFRLFSTASFRDVSRARVQRQNQKDKLKAFFDEGYDAILMPVTPSLPSRTTSRVASPTASSRWME